MLDSITIGKGREVYEPLLEKRRMSNSCGGDSGGSLFRNYVLGNETERREKGRVTAGNPLFVRKEDKSS